MDSYSSFICDIYASNNEARRERNHKTPATIAENTAYSLNSFPEKSLKYINHL